MPATFNMSDAMVSYSRKDKTFVNRLVQALKATGREVWVDWEDIPLTAEWWSEVKAGIEAAHTFIFIISPSSIQSDVCRKELEHAITCNKRVVPILHQPIQDASVQALVHPLLSQHQWIFFRENDDFAVGFNTLVAGLETDLEYNRLHTRLLVRGNEWAERGRSGSLVLRGDDLREAENWLTRAVSGGSPPPTPMQVEYIRASRQAARRWTQQLIGGAITALLLVITGSFFALNQSQRANAETQRALEQAQLRATQEWLANAGLAEAATAQKIANDSQAAAATSQALVLIAQTQEREAVENSGNSQTQAYIAQESALTATVLQGEANAKAATAQQQQATAEHARDQAEAQVNVAQQQAAQVQAAQQAAKEQAAATGTAAAAEANAIQQTVAPTQTAAVENIQMVGQTLTPLQDSIIAGNRNMGTLNAAMQATNSVVSTELAAALATQSHQSSSVDISKGQLEAVRVQATQQILEETAEADARSTQIAIDDDNFNIVYGAVAEAEKDVNQKLCVITRECWGQE